MFQAVKGTRDFYPEDMQSRSRIFEILRKTAARYGYREVESPAFESLKLLTAKSGDEVKSQIFVMEKRSTEEIGLRFDLTVPLTRMFIEKQKELPKPVKWFYLTRMWRYEAPQKGRLREFYQFGVELFGTDKIEADAEMISLAIDCLIGLGLTEKDFVIKINNRQLLQGYLESLGVKDFETALRAIDKKNKITKQEFREELEFMDSNQLKCLMSFLECKNLESLDKSVREIPAFAVLGELFTMLDRLGKGKYIQFTPEVVRGLGYYTGTVFECFDRSGKFRAILGGGRYDNMIEQFGGEPSPAVGFAMGDVVIELFLADKGLWKDAPKGVQFYIAPVAREYQEKAMEIASMLRKKFSVEIDLMSRKLVKQFSYANAILAEKVIIVGDETKSGNVKVKDMKTGKEQEMAISSLIHS